MAFVVTLLIVILIAILTSLPLYYSVKIFGGDVSIFKAIVINMMGGFLVLVIEFFFKVWGGLVGILAMLFLYKIAFDISFLKASGVWIIQGLVLVALVFLFSLFGLVSLAALGTATMTGAHILAVMH